MIYPRTVQTRVEVAGHYDQLDRVYREVWGEHVHHGLWTRGDESRAEATDALTDFVMARLGIGEDARIVDIGCGYAKSAERIAAARGAQVTGFTVSAEQAAVGQARRPPRGSITIHCRDWLENGLPDAAFDAAYAIESSEHFTDKTRFFGEAYRALKPGGRLVVCAWLAKTDATAWEVDYLLEPICREGRLPSMGTREDYEGLAAAAGFSLAGYDDISTQVAKTWTICIRRLAGFALTRPSYWALLVDPRVTNKIFAVTMVRLAWALKTGAMRYGVFVFAKP